ncbi:hypothetical protein EJP81_09635 [Rahnella aquatilis]|mgnify:FL=1|jgi:hypothetical protein|uniref:Uncharacterized protein n=1 Tax=Rahnella sp. (strain Y9602) TaxID=2703885 RepID=A0A0H3F8P7_RAHSY|nr:excisionase family protein [Rahnella aceris]AFE58241.1 hypothetical protein Q7S_10035 [Rahnella aquatilis HX2]AZP42089.1 hypothetical protein EJP79_09630 [Rahnella aquatilis]ADW73591.1 protein of unknown function DUF1233 excisionase [Rahnella aceris]AZP46429.1 hypothetical protein EJP81_09635 [Rahnella aquatilis]CAH0160943.1 hypothetical protein SRABI106_00662 [Rahnella aquatilis]
MSTHNIIQLEPNDWVTEDLLIALTRLKSGTINQADKAASDRCSIAGIWPFSIPCLYFRFQPKSNAPQ